MVGRPRKTSRKYVEVGRRGEAYVAELLPVGETAPTFTADASDGLTYELSEVLKRGHVALVFYPGNNTPG